ncbi:MAG: ACT domain-containing protein [Actinomycetota bacterium]
MTDFVLRALPEELAVCRLAPDAPRPTWAKGVFVSITRSLTELSVICDEASVPSDVRAERGWRALVLTGELDLALVGVLKQVLDPLAVAGVSVFVVSTFDTEFVLVRRFDAAVTALEEAGFEVLGASVETD